MMRRLITAMALLSAVFVLAQPVSAELQLRAIMRDLGDRVEKIARGISTGDFELIEKNAMLIAEHEKPSMSERMRILGFLNAEAAKFKSGDDQVHAEASKLAEAARVQDYDGVLTAFSGVLKGCVNCHSGYRQRIVDHFYEERK